SAARADVIPGREAAVRQRDRLALPTLRRLLEGSPGPPRSRRAGGGLTAAPTGGGGPGRPRSAPSTGPSTSDRADRTAAAAAARTTPIGRDECRPRAARGAGTRRAAPRTRIRPAGAGPARRTASHRR